MTNIKSHPKQLEAFHDPTRFKFVLAGRRGGKTHMIVEDMCRYVHKAPRYGEIAYIGPSNQQAKELIWEPLEERLYNLKWDFKALISKSRFELSDKRKIYVLGAEKISRIRGHKLFRAYLDELAFFEKPLGPIWRAIRPALSDYRGGAILSTTPNGKGTEAYDVFIQALTKPNWKTFTWKTIDNPWIDKAEIEEAKFELDEKSFKQEYEAEWESFEGLAYYNFSETTHLIKQGGINTSIPVYLCFDFNVNPTSLLVAQKHDDNKIRFIKEYSQKNSSTENTVKAFCEDHKEIRNRISIKIRGDASGKNRSSGTGKSDYFYAEDVLSQCGYDFTREVPAKNPPIVDRVKYANGWLKPFKGAPRIEIDPSCGELVRDLSSQELNGRVPSDKNNLGHKADAFGYCIYWEHMKGQRKPQATIEL